MDAVQPHIVDDGKPVAIDLSHHLSSLAKNRVPSPLKGMYKYFVRPGILQLAGGVPNPAVFPFETITCTSLKSNTFKTAPTPGYVQSLWNWIKGVETDEWVLEKYDKDKTKFQLSTALQYGTAQGLPGLHQFIDQFVAHVFDPAYSDFKTVINAGSTDAWSKIVTTLCEPGDGVLCEEWTYPSALATAWPHGMKPVPLPMDGGGLTVSGMDQLLGSWDPAQHDGMRRPRILYTVPVCQNPTGATMTFERKREIYALAVKYDVIIVEDDPYYFLQAGPYSPPSVRAQSDRAKSSRSETDEEFLKSLVPSYLRCDYQGRVVRIDTFSKTICPGSRLGFTVASPIIAERLEKANESSTQSASGFSQALVGKLLAEQWGLDGYLRWLKGIKAQYRDRRDVMVDLLVESTDAGLEGRKSSTGDLYELFARGGRDEKGFSLMKNGEKDPSGKKLLSFVAPEGGMFIWLRIHFAQHPSYGRLSLSYLLQSLWTDLAEHDVLVAPGSMFSGRAFPPEVPTDEYTPSDDFSEAAWQASVDEQEGDGFFRISFSSASREEMKRATDIVGKRVAKFFSS
ncbi:aminotransferase-like domain-containing protein [Sporobolomyces koalae]|uniref:aminotransferase-like domain-containing protein n=1 Tax=Sporobolomyces koalae TaxID=500713 RepID=UPI0031716AE0